MMEKRRIGTSQPMLRSEPMRPRAWEEFLSRDDATVAALEGVGEMVLVPLEGQLHFYYAFATLEDMRQHFAAMFEQIQPHIGDYDADYVVLDLVEVPNRQWLEPMLVSEAFKRTSEWIDMGHPDLDPNAVPEFPEGVSMRKATEADHDRIRQIWGDAYGDLSEGERTADAHLAEASWTGVLEADGEIVAFAINGPVERAEARILGAAVAPEAQGNGYGKLVLAAAAYQLTTQEVRKATVRVWPDMPLGARTARSLGFQAGRMGIRYRRTTDEAAIAEEREERRIAGVKARFGKWR